MENDNLQKEEPDILFFLGKEKKIVGAMLRRKARKGTSYAAGIGADGRPEGGQLADGNMAGIHQVVDDFLHQGIVGILCLLGKHTGRLIDNQDMGVLVDDIRPLGAFFCPFYFAASLPCLPK